MSTHTSAIITTVTLYLNLENLVVISLHRLMGNDKLEKGAGGIFNHIQKLLP